MAARTSALTAAAEAKRAEKQATKQVGQPLVTAATHDSFVNLAHKLGLGADNILTSGSYGFNPISRNRTNLEWIHRGSWIGGVAVDLIADDMTRKGVEFLTELDPEQSEQIEHAATRLKIWHQINAVIKWGRLYGGAICVALIDGQDPRTPLRLDTVGPGQFKGLITFDRWMVEPSLNDLVTEFGPDLGLPRYYRINSNAPALRNTAVHYSRVVVRAIGIELPYQQQLTENLWGISVLERVYDRMIAYDTASSGIAQLVGKAYLRTLSIDGLRDVVAAGGKPMEGLIAYTEIMRRFQGIEGITMIDAKDKFDGQSHQAFSGISDTLLQIGQQLAGALQIPLVRLFGQSPAGLNSTGESDLRMFYDHIKQEQQKVLHDGLTKVYKLIAASLSIQLPPTFAIGFKSLMELYDKEKAEIAKSVSDTVAALYGDGIYGRQTALRELRQSSRVTGIGSNITTEMIEAAEDDVAPPGGEDALAALGLGPAPLLGQQPPSLPGVKPNDKQIRPNGQADKVDEKPISRKPLLQPTPQRRPANRDDS